MMTEHKDKKVAKKSNQWDRAQEFARFFGIIFNNALRTGETAYFTWLIRSVLDSDYQAAAGMSMSWRLFLQSPYLAAAIATSIVTSFMDGEKIPREKIQQALRNGQLIGIFWAILTCQASLFIEQILTLLGQPKKQIEIAGAYFMPGYTLTLPAMMLTLFNEKYLLGLKGWHFVPALGSQVISSLLYLLSPYFDKNDMRFRSMGLGTAAQYWTNFILLEIYMAVVFKIKTSQFKFNKKYFKQILKMFYPLVAQIVMELATVNIDDMFAGLFGGKIGAMLYSVALPYISLLVILTLGLADAVRLLVSSAMGEKNYCRARMWGWGGLAFGTILAAIIAVVFYIWRDPLAKIFLSSDVQETIVTLAGWLVFMVGAGNFTDLIRNISTTLDITIGNTWFPIIINSISLALGVSVSALLGYFLGKNDNRIAAHGVFGGQIVGLTSGILVILAWIRQSITNKAMELTQTVGYWFGLWKRTEKIDAKKEKKEKTDEVISPTDTETSTGGNTRRHTFFSSEHKREHRPEPGCFGKMKEYFSCNIL
ncbi:MAG: MATE family efflux transporter [Gammaproteobacteria bacterium]|jgi:Na+-driven multidrug efflux pump